MSEFIPLSVPNFGPREAELASEAITSGWVSTSGGKVTEFEEALANYVGMPRAVACNAGSSALHLAAMAAGITRGDEVIVPTLTFIAAVNPLTRYVGAEPIFIGCDNSLCIAPDAVEDFCANHCELRDGKLYNKTTGAHVKALEAVHVFGNMADMPRLMAIARRYGLILIEDATEALGTQCIDGPFKGKFAGTIGDIGCYSFNGNKIITTSGGGALVCREEADAQHALKMATQAREPVAWYEHTELGYNYRMSNICAGIGRGQMEVLEQRVAQKRAIHDRYCDALAGLPLQLPAEPGDVRSNRWLTAALLAPDCSVTPGQIIAALAEHNIEARHIWKPMHLQPVFRDCAFVKTAERSVAEDVFARGVCLPSDTKMTPEQQAQVCAVIRGLF